MPNPSAQPGTSERTAAHSPEPWFIDEIGDVRCATTGIFDDDEHTIAVSNRYRIVAAVNACAGLSLESLEQGCIQRLVEAARDALDIESQIQPHDSIVGRNERLCETLRAALAPFSSPRPAPGPALFEESTNEKI